MPKFIYVQLRGVEKPAKIRADKVEEFTEKHGHDADRLSLTVGQEKIAEFKLADVQGWWIVDEVSGESGEKKS